MGAETDILRQHIERLVDEKHALIAEVGALKTENAELKLANERLGEATKALIAEKGALQRDLVAARTLAARLSAA